MFKKILIILAAIIAILCIVIALQPAEFTITRSIRIAASPEKIFAEIDDLHRWQAWSPWAKMDPDAKISFDGPPAGVGSIYSWDGKKSGAGRMIGIESIPGRSVKYVLEFKKPFQATNIAAFTLAPEGGETRVTWSMSGKNGFLFKAVGLVMNSDKMIGGDFEKGLSDLKSIVEAGK